MKGLIVKDFLSEEQDLDIQSLTRSQCRAAQSSNMMSSSSCSQNFGPTWITSSHVVVLLFSKCISITWIFSIRYSKCDIFILLCLRRETDSLECFFMYSCYKLQIYLFHSNDFNKHSCIL